MRKQIGRSKINRIFNRVVRKPQVFEQIPLKKLQNAMHFARLVRQLTELLNKSNVTRLCNERQGG
jgi:hypothetical protein